MPHAPVDPRSVWWRSADGGAPGSDARAPLAGDATADVAVIGAGILGATVAADLAAAGLDVVVLESGRIGSGATGHSTAKVTALQSPKYAAIARLHGAEAAVAYAAASLQAVQRLLALGEEAGAGRDVALTWTDEDDEVDRLVAELAACRDAGLPVRPATAGEFDLPLRYGVALEEQGFVDPLAAVRGLIARAEASGARVHEATPVTGVSLTGDQRRVATASGGVVRAGHVVVATGLPILDRGGWFARTEPHRSYALALRTARRPEAMALRVGSATRSSRAVPDGDGWTTLVAGADHRTGRGGDTRERYEQLLAWAEERFGVQAELHRWSAQDWHTTDELPLAGPLVPGDDRVLAASGFQKWGLTSGTAAASALVARIRREPLPHVAHLFDPVRLRSPKVVPDLAKLNATTGWAMAEGWLRVVGRRGARPALMDGQGAVHREGLTPVASSRVDGVERSCKAVCPHLGGVVSWEPGDEAWGCPLHGSRFAPDGRVLSGPATTPLADVGD